MNIEGHATEMAPYQSCIGCFKGDTATLIGLRGRADWVIAAIQQIIGMSRDEACATFMACAKEEGCGPAEIPAGEILCIIRMCRKCAEVNGVQVYEERSGKIGGYAQPRGDRS